MGRVAFGVLLVLLGFLMFLPAAIRADLGSASLGLFFFFGGIYLIQAAARDKNSQGSTDAMTPNSTPHTDARASSALDQPPSARAGERER